MSDAGVCPFSIRDLLGDSARYLVPMYQRNYDWGEGEITQLLQDVLDYQHKSASDKRPQTYYIGTLVVYPRDDGSFEVIDGQQRFTTLSLLAIWLKHNRKKAVKMAWYKKSTSPSKAVRYRATPSITYGGELLSTICVIVPSMKGW